MATTGEASSERSERDSSWEDEADDASSYSTGASRSSYEDDYDDSRASSAFYSSQRSSSRSSRSFEDEDDGTSRSASSRSRSSYDEDESRSSQSYTETGEDEDSQSCYDDKDEYCSYVQSIGDDESRSSRSSRSERSDSFPESSTEDDDDYTSGTDSTYNESSGRLSASALENEVRSFLSPPRQQSSSFSLTDQQSRSSVVSAVVPDQEAAWPATASTSSVSKSFEDDVDDFFGESHASSTSFPPPEEEDPFATESPKQADEVSTGRNFDAQAFPSQDIFPISGLQSNQLLDATGLATSVKNVNLFGDQSTAQDASIASSKRSEFSRKAPANQPSGDFFDSFYSDRSGSRSESQQSSTIKSFASQSRASSLDNKAPADPDGTNAGAASVASSIKSAQSKRQHDFVDPFGVEPKRSTSTDFGSFSDAPSKASSKLAGMASDAEKQSIDFFSTEDPFAPTEFETFDAGTTSVFSTTSNAADSASNLAGLASFSDDADDAFFGSTKSQQSLGSKNLSKTSLYSRSQHSQSSGSSGKARSKNDDGSRTSSRSGGKASIFPSGSRRSRPQRGSPSKASQKSSVASRTSSRGSQSSQGASKKESRMSISEFLPPRPLTTREASVISGLTSNTLTQAPMRDEPSISLSEVFPSSLPERTSPAASQRSNEQSLRASDTKSQSQSKSSHGSRGSRLSKSSKTSGSSSRLSKTSDARSRTSESFETFGIDGGSKASGSRSTSKSKDDQVDSFSFDSALVDSSKNGIGLSSVADSVSGLGTIMESQDAAAENKPASNEFGASFILNDQESKSASNSASPSSTGNKADCQSTSSAPSNSESRLGSNDGSLSGLSISRSSRSKTATKTSDGPGGSMSVSSDSLSSSKSSNKSKSDESSNTDAFTQSKHSSTGSSFFGSRQSSQTNTFTQSQKSGNSSSPSNTTSENSGLTPSSRSSMTHSSVETRSDESGSSASSTSSSRSSRSVERSDVSSKQGFQTSQASTDSRPTFMSGSFSVGGSSRHSKSASKGSSSSSSSHSSSRSSDSRPSSFGVSSRHSELSPRSLRSRASSFGQDSRSFSRRESQFSGTDQSRQSKRSGGSSGRSGRSGRSRASSTSKRRGLPQSAGDSSREDQSKSSRSSLLSFGDRGKSQSGRMSPLNLFSSDDRSTGSRRSASLTRTHLKTSSSSSQRSGRRKGVEKVKSQLPDMLYYGKSISFLKIADRGLQLKNEEVHATVKSDQFRNLASIVYRKLSDLRPRLHYIISEAEWVHVHILLLYSRLFDCELQHHEIELPEEFKIEIPEDLHVLEPIACVLASVGIVKDDQNGVTYIPVAKPYSGKTEFTPHNPDDVTEFLEWTVKDGLGYDWNSSWEAVERERIARKQQALENGIKLPASKTERDEQRQEQKLLDWNLLAIEKWLGYDDEMWYSYRQACQILSRVADFTPNPKEVKTGSYAWLLPREDNEEGEIFVRVPRPTLTADTWMIASLCNFCALPSERTCTWYLKSKPIVDIDRIADHFLEASFK